MALDLGRQSGTALDIGHGSWSGPETFRTTTGAKTVEKDESAVVLQLRPETLYHKLQVRFAGIGRVDYLSNEDQLRDNAGQKLPCNFKIEVTDVHEACKIAKELNLGIIMIGALTSATNNFGPSNINYKGLDGIIAIKPVGIINDRDLKSTPEAERTPNLSNQVTIHRNKLGDGQHTITVGAGLTFAQVNEIIANELGGNFYVPVDLTTVNQALAGAVFATGAMGPSRIRISEIAVRVNMTNGTEINTYTDQNIEEHEGLIGLDGGVTEIELKIFERPPKRFGVAVPLKNTPANSTDPQKSYGPKAAKVLAHLYKYQNLHLEGGKIKSDWQDGYIDGVEIITVEDLELIIEKSANNKDKSNATRLLDEMKNANSSYLLYVTGSAEDDLENLFDQPGSFPDTLMELYDQETIGDFIAMPNLNEMKALREAIPDTARDEGRIKKDDGKAIFSTSTDVNTTIDHEIAKTLTPDQLIDLFNQILQPYVNYEQALDALAEKAAEENIEVSYYRYGHLQPRNMDPHMRVVVKAETENAAFKEVVATVKELKEQLTKALISLPEPIRTTHGEKGKIPELALIEEPVKARIIELINQAGLSWNFRAPESILHQAKAITIK